MLEKIYLDILNLDWNFLTQSFLNLSTDVYTFEQNLSVDKHFPYNLTLEPNYPVSNSDYYIKYMHLTFCPSSYGFLPQTTNVILLSDGRLFIDNGDVAEIYIDGFCIDNFAMDPNEKPFVSAFVCNNVVHSLR